MTSLMQLIRRAMFGRQDASNFSDAMRNVGQLEFTGRPADPAPFHGIVTESAQLDPTELPWELRDADEEAR